LSKTKKVRRNKTVVLVKSTFCILIIIYYKEIQNMKAFKGMFLRNNHKTIKQLLCNFVKTFDFFYHFKVNRCTN